MIQASSVGSCMGRLGWCEAEWRVLSTSLSKPADRAQAQHHVLLLLPWEQERRLCPLAADSLKGLIRNYRLVCQQV